MQEILNVSHYNYTFQKEKHENNFVWETHAYMDNMFYFTNILAFYSMKTEISKVTRKIYSNQEGDR